MGVGVCGRGCKGARVRGSKGARGWGCGGARVRTQVQGCEGAREDMEVDAGVKGGGERGKEGRELMLQLLLRKINVHQMSEIRFFTF